MLFKLLKRLLPFSFKQKLKRKLEQNSLIAFIIRANDQTIHNRQLYSLLRMKELIPAIAPKHLQIRVSNAYYPEFFDHGKMMLNDMEMQLAKHNLSLTRFNHILDFGCGCGRFMAPLSLMVDPSKLYGTDIDAEAIDWMKKNYGRIKDIDINNPMPPTKYADNTFDFIFSVSIFTHLPEEMHMEWVKELNRIMQPGGYGIFSTHGEFHYPALSADELATLKSHGFYYSKTQITVGLPEFYQQAFHTHEYIQREWGKYFEIVAMIKQGIGGGQDMIIVKKR